MNIKAILKEFEENMSDFELARAPDGTYRSRSTRCAALGWVRARVASMTPKIVTP